MGVARPEVVVSAGPGGSLFTYKSTKDLRFKAEGVDVDKSDPTRVKIDSIELTSLASPVIEANIEQMRVLGENYLKLGDAWATYTDSVTGLVGTVLPTGLGGLRQFSPRASVSGPLGLSGSVDAALFEKLVEAISKRLGLGSPASQPAGAAPE
jgi:hypothetical protein